ncbi:MAG: helix-turn-helix domain-containing protein [Oligoflexus sp.]
MEDEKKFIKLQLIIAINLKKYREARGFTQEDMMDYGFERRYYQRLEAGEVNPTLHTLFRLAESLGIETWSLLKKPRIKK